MIYLSVEKLAKNFPEHQLFEDLTFGIFKGDKVGLIANNGAGKSTLIRILTGKEAPDEGSVYLKDGIKMGFLEQDPSFPENLTVAQLIKAAHPQVRKAIDTYHQLLEEQADDFNEEKQQKLESITAEMERLNAWDYDRDLKAYLTRFRIDSLDQSVDAMSGGQRKRLALAIALADQPDLLILDEPTNHLDIDMIEWLENHLSQSSITLLMVTHDRYFLDSICNLILELHDGNLYRHQGNYAYFLEKRAEREATFDREIEKANSLLKHELEWMRRTPQARTTKAKSRIDAFYDLEKKSKSRRTSQEINLEVKMSRLGGKILELKNVRKSYGDIKILDGFTYTFKKGDRVGIVGGNGVGKSTFLNILTGREKANSGKVNLGETVVFGYYTQDGITTTESKRVIDVIKDIAENIQLSNGVKLSASQFLEFFLFPPEVQYKPVSKLSGGDRRRLYLMTVLIKNPNFLILDEPTNDLDLLTLNKLEEFLFGFDGCLVLVSHDRYFMDKLVDHLFIFEGEGQIKGYNGTYTEYRLQKKETAEKESIANSKPSRKKSPATTKSDNRPSNREKNEFRKLEREIHQLEKKISELEDQLATQQLDLSQIESISQEIGKVMTEIDHKTERWMELADKF